MRKYTKTVTVYELDFEKGFIVEVEQNREYPDYKDYHLYHKDYGVKLFMFSESTYLAIPEDDLIFLNVDDYIDEYKEKYMD